MPLKLNITVTEEGVEKSVVRAEESPKYSALLSAHEELRGKYEELTDQMGDHIAPFPAAGIDAFLSHFLMHVEFSRGPAAGNSITIVSPPAVQTVARSTPFVFQSASATKEVIVPLPARCTLNPVIKFSDFLNPPPDFFESGKETVWMQILNLDARMDSAVGPIRIILGETVKREYPDLFVPSLGVAQSLGQKGFPARLFFNPVAIVETPIGAFRAIHGILAYGRIVAFPPVGTAVTISAPVPMEAVEELRAAAGAPVQPVGMITALSHPIDVMMHKSADEAFTYVEARIAAGPRVERAG